MDAQHDAEKNHFTQGGPIPPIRTKTKKRELVEATSKCKVLVKSGRSELFHVVFLFSGWLLSLGTFRLEDTLSFTHFPSHPSRERDKG